MLPKAVSGSGNYRSLNRNLKPGVERGRRAVNSLFSTQISNHAPSSLSTMSSSLPTSSIPDSPHHNAPHASYTSIALIIASLLTFVVFVFLSVHRRPSRDALVDPSPFTATNKPSSKRKPKLWEVCLDEDHHRELTRLDGAVRNWEVSHTRQVCTTNVSRDIFAPTLAYQRVDWQSSGAAAVQPTCFCTTCAP